jgi:orotate phosphoribosyltransferase
MTEPKLSYTPFDYANLTAKWLLEIGAVEYCADPPFTWTSGRSSPIYVDVRKILGARYRARAEINAMSCNKLYETVEKIDLVTGGETAGIPFATMIAERMMKPLGYVRKKPKEFGRNAQIECFSDEQLAANKKILLVEDLCSDGGSKKVFVDAIRRSGNVITDVFAVFSYGCFGAAAALAQEGVRLIHLTDALTLINVADDLDWSTAETRDEIRRFLAAPNAWKLEAA